MVAHDGATFHGCLPVRPISRWVDGRPAVTTRLWDTDPPPGAPGGPPLVDAWCAPDAVRAMLGALGEARRAGLLAGVLVLERLLEGEPLTVQIGREASALGLPVHVRDRWQRAVVDNAVGGERTKAIVGSTASKAKKRYRHLAELLGEEVHVVDRSADPDAVEDLLALEASGWKGRAPTADGMAPLAAHFRDVCNRFREQGRLEVLSLEAAGRCLAMRSAIRAGDEYFTLHKAYDERYAAYGPGVLLDIEFAGHMLARAEIRRAHIMHGPSYREHNARVFSASAGLCTMVIATGGPFDRARIRTLPVANKAAAAARRARREVGSGLRVLGLRRPGGG